MWKSPVSGKLDRSGADRLDIVAVRIDQECGIIGRAVVCARAGAAIVAAAGAQARGMKFLDRGMVGRAERNMRAGADGLRAQIEPQRRRARGAETSAGFVAGTQLIA